MIMEASYNPLAINMVDRVEDIKNIGTYKIKELLPFHFQIKIEKNLDDQFEVLAMDKSSSSRFDYINFRQTGLNGSISTFKTLSGAIKALAKWRDKLLK